MKKGSKAAKISHSCHSEARKTLLSMVYRSSELCAELPKMGEQLLLAERAEALAELEDLHEQLSAWRLHEQEQHRVAERLRDENQELRERLRWAVGSHLGPETRRRCESQRHRASEPRPREAGRLRDRIASELRPVSRSRRRCRCTCAAPRSSPCGSSWWPGGCVAPRPRPPARSARAWRGRGAGRCRRWRC